MAENRDLSDDWTDAIGHYITAFAYIELLVYDLYSLLPADRLSKHGSHHRDYSDRARFLQALLRSTTWSQRTELDSYLESTFELSKLRNQIAHNPMFIEVWLDDDRKNHQVNPVITDAQKGHNLEHITLEVLKKKLDKLHDVSRNIQRIVLELHASR